MHHCFKTIAKSQDNLSCFERYRCRKGFGLVEATVMAAVIGLFSSGVYQAYEKMKKAFTRLEVADSLMTVLSENISEVHTRPLTALPAAGNCLVRDYTPQGNFIEELPGTYALSDSKCTDVLPDQFGIRIVIRVEARDDIDVTFDPPEFLKLPHYTNTIRQVQVAGAIKRPNEDSPRVFSITFFKRML